MYYVIKPSSSDVEHSAKGTRWKNHKYIRITPTGNYVYKAVNFLSKKVGFTKKTPEQRRIHMEKLIDALVLNNSRIKTDPSKLRVNDEKSKKLEGIGLDRIESLKSGNAFKVSMKKAYDSAKKK